LICSFISLLTLSISFSRYEMCSLIEFCTEAWETSRRFCSWMRMLMRASIRRSWACANNNNFGGLCKVMNRMDLIEDPKFADNYQRCVHEAELRPIIAEWTKGLGTMELLGMLMKNGVPCSPIQHTGQMLEHPHGKARGLVAEVTLANGYKVKVPGVAIKIDGQILPAGPSAPDVGQHNTEVFKGVLGMSDADIAALKEKGVI